MRFCKSAILITALCFTVGCASVPRFASTRFPANKADSTATYLTANQYERQGKYEAARTTYEAMLTKQPNNPDLMHRLAVVCTRLERTGEARNYYERAMQASPNDAKLLADYGYFHYLQGDLVSAEKLLSNAHQLKPSDRRTANNLALVIGMTGRLNESMTLLLKVSDRAEALAGMAYIHRVRGENDLAEAQYRAALAINPKQPIAVQGLADVTRIKSREPVSKVETASKNSLLFDETPAIEADPGRIEVDLAIDETPASEEPAAVVAEISFEEEPAADIGFAKTTAPPITAWQSAAKPLPFEDDEAVDRQVPTPPVPEVDEIDPPSNVSTSDDDSWADESVDD
jgi:Flp pilus assembly protein TadD